MIPTPLIMLKAPYSSISLLFGPLKWAQFIYITFLLWKRLEGKTSDILVIASSFADAFSSFGGVDLYTEMTNLFVRCLMCP